MNKFLPILILSSMLSGQSWFAEQMTSRQLDNAVNQYNKGRYAVCEAAVKRILENEPGEVESAARMLLFKALVAQDRRKDAKEAGRAFLSDFPTSTYISDVYWAFGDLFINERSFGSAFRYYIMARGTAVSNNSVQELDRRIVKTLQLKPGLDVIHELLATQADIQTQNLLYLSKAAAELGLAKPDDAALSLASVKPHLVSDAFLELYENMLLASYRPGLAQATVAVIAPLTGKNETEGKAFVAGVTGISAENGAGNISYVIVDNHSDGFSTVKAVREMEARTDIAAIIAPLSEENALLALTALGSSRKPLIIPGQIEDNLAELSSAVFQMQADFSMQGRLAALYAGNILGLDSLAVLATADDAGKALADAFVQYSDAMGKTIVAMEWYSGTPSDLSKQFKNLRKTAFALIPEEEEVPDVFGLSIDSLDMMFDVAVDDIFDIEEEKPEKMTSSDSADVELASIQAIYMPIHPGHLEFVANQFPVFNLNAKVIANEAWLDYDILGKDNIGPHYNGLTILTHRIHGKTDYESGESGHAFATGHNLGQLLQAVAADLDKDASFYSMLFELEQFRGDDSFFSFADGNRINSGLHVLEYNDRSFQSKGFFLGDSLHPGLNEAP